MGEQNVKAFIEEREFDQQAMNAWIRSRLEKAYRTFHQAMDANASLSQANVKLTDIKSQLSDDKIRAILKRKLDVSRWVMKIASVCSGKKRRVSRTTVLAKGITAEKFCRELDSLMTVSTEGNRRVNLSVYPEHYVLAPDKNGTLEVIETTGNAPIPAQFFITFDDETGLTEKRNLKYPYQSVGVARLDDGTIIGGVRHQFRDTEDGIECKLAVEFPALCPKAIIRAHEKHLAVEFANWLQWIIKKQKGN